MLFRIVLFAIILANICVASANVVHFGQSCALSGPRAGLGLTMFQGISAAFQQANAARTLGDTTLNLITLDDQFNATLAVLNTKFLIQQANVSAMIGSTGANTSLPILNTIKALSAYRVPLFGPGAGAAGLRAPGSDPVVNLRVSVSDELNALIKFIIAKRIGHLSAVYQTDFLAAAASLSFTIALNVSGVSVRSAAGFTPMTNMSSVARTVLTGLRVQAIVLIGDGGPIAQFIHLARREYSLPVESTYFLMVSSMDHVALYSNLTALGEPTTNIYITQVVPPPEASNLTIVRKYKEAMQTYYPESALSPGSLEGYITAQLAIEAVDRSHGNTTGARLLETIYDNAMFYLGGITLGPYLREQPRCNQGMREVYLSSLQPDGTLSLDEFQYKWTDSCASSDSATISVTRIVWGQSAGLTGFVGRVSNDVRSGIQAAFWEANRFRVIPNTVLELITMDDQYEPTLAAQNTLDLYNNQKVFGFIGNVGTAPVAAALAALKSIGAAPPFINPVTGSQSLRAPFQRNVVYIRASYVDEAAAMVSFLTNRFVSKISVFFQNDTFGFSALNAVERALNASGLSVQSSGRYPRNTNDVSAGIQEIFQKSPEAIIMAGTAAPLSAAIKYARKYNADGKDVIFMCLSSVGIEALQEQLHLDNVSIDHVYVTQTMPPPFDPSEPLVDRYLAALTAYDSHLSPSFFSLEGYMTGLFVVENIIRTRGALTPQSFLDAIYDSQLFLLEKRVLGPYADGAYGSTPCNQGMRAIWLAKCSTNTTYEIVPDANYTWTDSCVSTPSDVRLPIVFGQSAPMTGAAKDVGINMRIGILAAFNQFNRAGGLEGRQVLLHSHDDAYDPELAAVHTQELLDSGVLALLGYVGSPAAIAASNISKLAKVPFIAPYSGASKLRSPCHKYIVNMRSSYIDESASMVSFLLAPEYSAARNHRSFSNIALFYQNDSVANYYEGAVKALAYLKRTLSGMGSYQSRTLDVEPALRNITASGVIPDAVIMIGTYAPVGEFLRLAKQTLPKKTVYLSISFVGVEQLAAEALLANVDLFDDQGFPTVYVSTVIPSPYNIASQLIQEYHAELAKMSPPAKPNYISFEGYLSGRFVTRTLQLVEGELTSTTFTNAIYEKFIYNLEGFHLGPFLISSDKAMNPFSSTAEEEITSCNCSQGSHQAWLTYLGEQYKAFELPGFRFSFNTCGVSYTEFGLQILPTPIRDIIIFVSVLCVVCVIVFGALIFVYRNRPTIRAASPIFLGMILIGCLLLSLSPLLWIDWDSADATRSDQLCMTWVWSLGLGFTMLFAPLCVKTYRVYRIFVASGQKGVITIRDRDLFIYLAIPVCIELIILDLWTSLAPLQLRLIRIPGTVDQTMRLCTTANGEDFRFIVAQAVFLGILAVVACLFAFKTRRVRYGAFKESTEIIFASYNLTFFGVVLVPLAATLTFTIVPSAIIRTLGVLFQVFVFLIVLFGIKIYRILAKRDRRSSSSRPGLDTGPLTTPRSMMFSEPISGVAHQIDPSRQSAYTLPFESSTNTTMIRSTTDAPSSSFRMSEYSTQGETAGPTSKGKGKTKVSKPTLAQVAQLATLSQIESESASSFSTATGTTSPNIETPRNQNPRNSHNKKHNSGASKSPASS